MSSIDTFAYLGNCAGKKDYLWTKLLDNPPKLFSVDIETRSLKDRTVIGVGFGLSPAEALYVPSHSPEFTTAITMLCDPSSVKIFHNVMFDLPILLDLCPEVDTSNVLDSMLMCVMEGLPQELARISDCLGQPIKRIKDILPARATMDQLPDDVVADKCLHDCTSTMLVYESLWPHMDREYFLREMELVPVLMAMSRRGIKLDQGRRKILEDKLTEEVEFYRSLAEGEGFNPASTQQVAYILMQRGNRIKISHRGGKYSVCVDEEVLKNLDDPIAALVLNFRKASKLLGTYIKPYADQDRAYTRFHLNAATGRISSTERNMQNIPPGPCGHPECKKDGHKRCVHPKGELDNPGIRTMLLPDSGWYSDFDYCLSPDTKVLTANLTWVTLDSITLGQEIIGVDELSGSDGGHWVPTKRRWVAGQGGGYRRKFRRAIVEGLSVVRANSYRITLDNGLEAVCSGGHRWLNCPQSKKSMWISTENLKVGMNLKVFGTPWKVDNSYMAGWLAGFLDGEGYVMSDGVLMGFAQKPGHVSEFAKDVLTYMGVPWTEQIHNGLDSVRICSLYACLRLLGSVRPLWLTPKGYVFWEGRDTVLFPRAKVVAVEPLGEMELIGIRTSTKTLIANGLISHNSQQELRTLAYISHDTAMLDIYERGGDIHQETADFMHIIRRTAKNVTFSVVYGADDRTVMETAGIKDLRLAHELIVQWGRKFPQAWQWILDTQEQGLVDGYVKTLQGRKLWLPADDVEGEEGRKRKASNYLIQGSAAEMTKAALLACARKGYELVLQVHDEVVIDGKVEEEELRGLGLEYLGPFHCPVDVCYYTRWQ